MIQVDTRESEIEIDTRLHLAATMLDAVLNNAQRGADREIGFVLLTFSFNKTGSISYLSNGPEQSDIIKLLREVVSRFDERDAAVLQ